MHFHGDAHGGKAGAFAASGLQHVEHVVLDGELEILHVAEMRLQTLADGLQRCVDAGHLGGQLGDGLRRTNAGHHVFALGIQQILAV